MACYVTGSSEGDARLATSEARKEATHVTRLLCTLLGELESRSNAGPLLVHLYNSHPDLKAFWDEHRKIDAERRAKENEALWVEAHRKSALKKLTDAEKRALGL